MKRGTVVNYKEGIIRLPCGGTIEMKLETKRPKRGKGSSTAMSTVKRIFNLRKVKIPTNKLLSFANIKGCREKIISVSSSSQLSKLKVENKGDISYVSGQATYQALQTLGLDKYVIV